MGAVIQSYNHELMGMANYRNHKTLRRLYRRYYQFEHLARAGDAVAASIYIDMKTALYHPGVLTDKQRECIVGLLVDNKTFRELEAELERDKATIHQHVASGIKRLQASLESGELYK